MITEGNSAAERRARQQPHALIMQPNTSDRPDHESAPVLAGTWMAEARMTPGRVSSCPHQRHQNLTGVKAKL